MELTSQLSSSTCGVARPGGKGWVFTQRLRSHPSPQSCAPPSTVARSSAKGTAMPWPNFVCSRGPETTCLPQCTAKGRRRKREGANHSCLAAPAAQHTWRSHAAAVIFQTNQDWRTCCQSTMGSAVGSVPMSHTCTETEQLGDLGASVADSGPGTYLGRSRCQDGARGTCTAPARTAFVPMAGKTERLVPCVSNPPTQTQHTSRRSSSRPAQAHRGPQASCHAGAGGTRSLRMQLGGSETPSQPGMRTWI